MVKGACQRVGVLIIHPVTLAGRNRILSCLALSEHGCFAQALVIICKVTSISVAQCVAAHDLHLR